MRREDEEEEERGEILLGGKFIEKKNCIKSFFTFTFAVGTTNMWALFALFIAIGVIGLLDIALRGD